jgi:glycosyltransferase involved in cell wall biosynthesis
MNVLFLDQFSELGGAQRCLLDLLPAIEERGWRASAALPGSGPLVEALRARHVDVHEIPCGPYQSGRKSLPDVVRFMRDLRSQVSVLRSLNFDLLYVNGPRLLVAAAIALDGRAPVLFHAHSRIPPGLLSSIAGWSIRRMNAAVIACSSSVAPNVPRDKLSVIANGTPDLGFRERSFNHWRIGIIGRISPEKGQTEFLRAAAILAPQFPEVRFVICGAPILPAGNYFDTVRELAKGLPVELLGWREDVAPVLAELDLLAIPSTAEGMPRVLLEAFSAGVPVVAFPVGGIPEVIADMETGFLVPEKTSGALAGRMREIMLLGQAPLQTIAANARRAWERLYTVENYRKNVTDLMERLVSDWQAARETAPPPQRR